MEENNKSFWDKVFDSMMGGNISPEVTMAAERAKGMQSDADMQRVLEQMPVNEIFNRFQNNMNTQLSDEDMRRIQNLDIPRTNNLPQMTPNLPNMARPNPIYNSGYNIPLVPNMIGATTDQDYSLLQQYAPQTLGMTPYNPNGSVTNNEYSLLKKLGY